MLPETGNLAADSKQLPVSGGIKTDILMPPETGNLAADSKQLFILNHQFNFPIVLFVDIFKLIFAT